MKVLFVDGVEKHKAWRDSMGCMHCGELLFNVHKQISPPVEPNENGLQKCWWVECPNCGHEGPHAATRELALKGWHDDDSL